MVGYLIGAVCILMIMTLILLHPASKWMPVFYFLSTTAFVDEVFQKLIASNFVCTDSQWAVVVFSQSGKFAVTAVFQLIWMYTAELFPTKYRSLAVGLSSVVARAGSVCSPYINDLFVSVLPLPT